ncbi:MULTISPECIES: hypothetical protein [Clostridium]|uniref:Lipoprotein n=1 Tax=Clostridium tagluense TaxID=360422 RepID=A0A401UPY7_9CLOT|nr:MULTISPECIES: hypothetical protein [Clostridium]MBZ9634019.1 hypothetical protein [Clostridium sp. FP1]MCB2300756.1 hypothetical protein [Clostridium tagluense]GCD11581.1 hypothetical protein Ctaglu_32040 [Clostridium tagluense]
MKKILLYCLTILSLLVLLVGCSKKVNDSNKPEMFKSDKLGFSIVFPKTWKDKYRVEENDMGITVYFKPKEKAEGGYGKLFAFINKNSANFYEDSLDTICDQRYFEAKGATYVIGGPTDLNFPEEHPEFNTFLKMKGELKEVLKTLKIIDK